MKHQPLGAKAHLLDATDVPKPAQPKHLSDRAPEHLEARRRRPVPARNVRQVRRRRPVDVEIRLSDGMAVDLAAGCNTTQHGERRGRSFLRIGAEPYDDSLCGFEYRWRQACLVAQFV